MAKEFEEIKIININDYDYSEFYNMKPLKRRGRKREKVTYLNNVSAFDIEVSNIDTLEVGVMYIWQFAVNDKVVIIGRYWEEFSRFINKVNEIIGDYNLVVLIHNASYEFQFIKSEIPITNIFAMDNRKVAKFNSNNIEFRCSYIRSNMSLKKYLQKENVKHQKLEMDYNKVWYPWSELPQEVIDYSINDVIGLVEAYTSEMEHNGHDLYNVPMTSTGDVRTLVKERLGGYKKYLQKLLPPFKALKAMNLAMRGGNTHGNRFITDIIMEKWPMFSDDIASSYPAVIAMCRMPGAFVEGNVNDIEYYITHDRAVLMHIYLYDLELINEDYPVPYLSRGKALSYSNLLMDNGRILKGNAEYWITEIDLKIIKSQYRFKFHISECYVAFKSLLPYTFRELVKEMFTKKTALKGGDENDKYFYGKYKNLINSLYGLTCQNPLRPSYKYDAESKTIIEDESITLEDTYNKYLKYGWLPYQWGLYITCYARERLEMGIRAIYEASKKDGGIEKGLGVMYCDTDSIYYSGDYHYVIEELNKHLINDYYSAVDRDGKRHYLGIYEEDHTDIKRYKHLGAKKYAYEDFDGKLHITISGVNKARGAVELDKLENFKEGFVFSDSGGTESKFIDEVQDIVIDGRKIRNSTNIYIKNSTYTLGLFTDYKELLAWLAKYDIRKKLYYDYNL